MKNELYNRRLTKEEIKAIRIVRGFNKDLRVKLTTDKEAFMDFIDENICMLGFEYSLMREEAKAQLTSHSSLDLYEGYHSFLQRLSAQVVNGEE